MKMMKKLFAIALVAAMVMALCVTAFAAGKTSDSGKGGSASITITLPTDNAKADAEITYTVYKVFDATNNGTSNAISYQIDSKNGNLTAAMTAAGFSVDTAGNVSGPASLNDAALAAIAAYAKDSIGTFKAKPTTDGTLTITGLQYGYYYITTTTGTVVTVDSTNPNAEVQDKNTIPSPPDKKITGVGDGSLDEAGENALAQVGTTVNFSVDIVKVKGATNYVFHDKMDAGLSYKGDVAVTPSNVVANTTTASGDTITVTFDNEKLAALEDNTKITITYSATVTSDALTTDPANNTATLDYGEGNTTEKDTVSVYNAKFTVTKKDGEGKALPGAGFVIKNAAGKYYKLADNVVSWVDSIDAATEYTSDTNGVVTAFTGLANGTYTLVEKTVPKGYNKAADSTFTIAEKDFTADNLEQTANVENKQGTEMPSTGGIGTKIFYGVGAVLVIGAGVVLMGRKRAAD